MPLRIQCPTCKTPCLVPDEQRGKVLRCGSCQKPFRTPALPAPPPEEPAEVLPLDDEPATPAARLRESLTDDSDRAPRLRPGRRQDREAGEDSPAPRRKKGPRAQPAAPKGTSTGLIVGLIAGAAALVVALLVGGVLVIVAWSGSGPDPVAQAGNPAALPVLPALPPDNGPQPRKQPDPGPRNDPPPWIEQPAPSKKEPEPRQEPPPVWAPVKPAGIRPPALKDDKTTLRLPGSVRDVCVGGGGRYLILHLPQQRQLGIFDANEARVVKYLPGADDNIKFAAGMDKLLVAVPDKNLIQRWDLTTLEREVTAPLPAQGTVNALYMGAASSGPLLVGLGNGVPQGGNSAALFLDPRTLKAVTYKWSKEPLNNFTSRLARLSPDGTVVAWHEGAGGEPHALKCGVLSGGTANGAGVWPAAASLAVPGPDDRTLFTAAGLFNTELKQTSAALKGSFLPATSGPYFLGLEKDGLSFYLAGNDRPVAKLAGVEGICEEGVSFGSCRDTINHDRRIHFIPEARLVVGIPTSNDRLLLYRFDPEQALEKSDVDYLVVTSQPPRTAARGKPYSYTLRIKSKKGGVRCKLESGPDGLKATADGKVTWDVPRDFPEGEVAVLLTVADATGQEIIHTFKLQVTDRAEAPPAEKEAPAPPDPAAREQPPLPPKEPPVKEPPRVEPPPPNPPPVRPPAPPAAGERLSINAAPRTAPMVVALSPDGKALAVLTLAETEVKVYDTSTGKEKVVLRGVEKHPYCVAFSPDGTLLAASGEDPVVRVWEVATGKEKAALRGQRGTVFTLAFAPDGKSIAAAGQDRTIQLWNLDTQEAHTLDKGHPSNILRIAFSADGKTLFSASLDGALKLWDVAGKQERAALTAEGGLLTAALAPAGDLAATDSRNYTRDRTIRLWDLTNRKLAATLPGHSSRVEKMAFSPDGKLLASVGADQSLRLSDVGRRQAVVSVPAHRGPVKYVTFSGDGRTLATCGLDGVIKVWDVAALTAAR
jgi:WD40 repeat protein